MRYQETFPTPNSVVDKYLRELTGSEAKLLLVVIRQTYGWVDTKIGGRKMRDRISHGQFIKKAGLSRRAVSSGVEGCLRKGSLR